MGTLSVPQTTRPFGYCSVSGRSPDRALCGFGNLLTSRRSEPASEPAC